eukprot:TRINITY_DN67516_c10_g1_i1.p1 TRINITY_DN67516_c10_g1~~TRINITY_DN67516_c10_g1_i1.p1  ORF type:complete len:347 (+),score=30.20 TRINITY_DN67516_c10_g1_i1:67-1107(+)
MPENTSETPKPKPKNPKAAYHWKLLKSVLTKKQISRDETHSVRRIQSFGLISKEKTKEDASYEWISYTLPHTTLCLRQRKEESVSFDDVQAALKCGVDNTGAFMWLAEETLTHYFFKHPELYSGKRILEIGSGVGLLGFSLHTLMAEPQVKTASQPNNNDDSSSTNELSSTQQTATQPTSSTSSCAPAYTLPPQAVCISDGNPSVVDNLQWNATALENCTATCKQVLWHKAETYNNVGAVDLICGADCLFFEQFHDSLIEMFDYFLAQKEDVQILLLQPKRGKSMQNFIDKWKTKHSEQTTLVVVEDFDPQVTAKHQSMLTNPDYDANLHQPLLMRINRPRKAGGE